MSADIQSLSALLAADPENLAFLPLGEALRRRSQLDAALAVALRGVERYPALADAQDLLARVRSDRGEGDQAFDAWTQALRLDPEHVGALRGLAFLAFRSGDLARAEGHLSLAARLAPADAGLRKALDRVRERRRLVPAPTGFRDDQPGTLLVDAQGRRLAGILSFADGGTPDRSDLVAAELAGVSREVERMARLLDLGPWHALSAEWPEARWHLAPPTDETLLLLTAEAAMPAGRSALVVGRLAAAARVWLEELR